MRLSPRVLGRRLVWQPHMDPANMTRLWLLQPCRTGVAVAVAVAVVAELGVGYNLEDPRLHRGEAE